ncbi:MAG: hypothetical protein WCF07_11830 [Nitrososphaeraceae archaeon]
MFRSHIVLWAGISDAPPRSRAHADWPAHLRSDRRPAADFRYRGIDKLVTEVETLLGTATLPSSLFILMTNRLDPTVLPT